MGIHFEKDRVKGLTVFRAAGDVSFDELESALRAFYMQEPTRDILCDFSRGTIKSFTWEDIYMIKHIAQKYRSSRESGRTALVAYQEVDYGVSNMIQGYLSDLHIDIKVFRA